METILRWAGSKRQLLSKLKAYWTGGETRYVEPFCGSACFFFDLEPKRAILGDLNSELITAYRALKKDVHSVCEHLRRLPKGKRAYYKIRAIDPLGLDEPERAARFLYLNRYCFNGIYRTNRLGHFNVPRGSRAKKIDFDYERIGDAAKLLSRVTLLNNDFANTLERVKQGDFVYLDPPYAVSDRKIFAEYHQNSFSVNDLDRLGEMLNEINEKGATFVISYADSREARELLAAWKPKRVRTRRHVAGFAGDRRSAYELIASNLEELVNVE
jgi:DNA adenine methylase